MRKDWSLLLLVNTVCLYIFEYYDQSDVVIKWISLQYALWIQSSIYCSLSCIAGGVFLCQCCPISIMTNDCTNHYFLNYVSGNTQEGIQLDVRLLYPWIFMLLQCLLNAPQDLFYLFTLQGVVRLQVKGM